VGVTVSLEEAASLVVELRRESGSHLNAAEGGWEFAATYGEQMAFLHSSSFINANRDTKAHPQPIRLPNPWPDEEKAEEVTEEERAALRARLVRHSAFAK
jgi:hypothetical protein